MEGLLALAILIILLLPVGLIVLFRKGLKLSKARARSIALSAKLKDPKYIAEEEERRKKELAYIKETLEKCKKNPDINIAIYNDEAWQIHWDRLNTYGRSMHSGEMYYKGQSGGIYTLSANGSRNYKY